METYSLLQLSLDQTIARESLEDASAVVRSVSRADCAKLQRELFGILISGLEWDEAVAFQAELKHRDFPTELVADDDLPVLHEPYTIQRIALNGRTLDFADAMGRVQTRPVEDLIFLAGGFSTRTELKTMEYQKVDYSTRGMPRLVTDREAREEHSEEFRLDFFFTTAPHRLQARLSGANAMFYQDHSLRLRLRGGLLATMEELRALLPPERTNSGLQRRDAATAYPNLSSYEKEIRWHFHRCRSSAPDGGL